MKDQLFAAPIDQLGDFAGRKSRRSLPDMIQRFRAGLFQYFIRHRHDDCPLRITGSNLYDLGCSLGAAYPDAMAQCAA